MIHIINGFFSGKTNRSYWTRQLYHFVEGLDIVTITTWTPTATFGLLCAGWSRSCKSWNGCWFRFQFICFPILRMNKNLCFTKTSFLPTSPCESAISLTFSLSTSLNLVLTFFIGICCWSLCVTIFSLSKQAALAFAWLLTMYKVAYQKLQIKRIHNFEPYLNPIGLTHTDILFNGNCPIPANVNFLEKLTKGWKSEFKTDQ